MAAKTKARDHQSERGTRGLGTVFWNEKRQRWIGRKPIGTTPDGRTLYVQRSDPDHKALVKKMREAEAPGDDITFKEWATRWLDSLDVRESTLESYRRSLLDHCAPLGRMKLSAVKVGHANALLVKLAKGDGDRDGLSPGSVVNVRAHAAACFEAAIRDELVTRNPFAHARRPEVEKKEIDPLTLDELNAVVGEWKTLSAGPMLAVLATTGMRLGEASALDVTDWNPSTGKLSVTKTYSQRFGVGPPKSKNGKRTITVPTQARPAITAAVGSRKTGPLFVTEAENRFIKSLIQRAFTRLLARLKIRRRNVHQLRHSVASHLINGGHPIGDAAKYLGDSAAVVVKTYLHPSGADAGAAMERLLGGGMPRPKAGRTRSA